MATSKRSIKRQKCVFGADGAMMAGAIALQTAAQIGMAARQAKATKDAAAQQAQAMVQNAQINSQATRAMADNDSKLANQRIESEKNENQITRDLMKQANDNILMLAGKQNAEDRYEQGKLLAKYGTSVNNRRKLKKGGQAKVSSTGGLGFKITDGDENKNNPLIPLQQTQDGSVIFMVHPSLKNHGQKNSDGKEGVGIATATDTNPSVPQKSNMEVEGGEIIKAAPGRGITSVISKRTLPGSNFNPKNYYLATGDYNGAFFTAENIKKRKGLNDDGSKKHTSSPVKKMAAYGTNNFGDNSNILGIPLAINAMTQVNNTPEGANSLHGQQNIDQVEGVNKLAKYGMDRRKLKCGGRSKKGLGYAGLNYIGAGAGTLANVIGGIFSNVANNKANKILSKGFADARDAALDEYENIKGIDISDINRSNFQTPHAVANLRTARVNKNAELEALARQERNLAQTNRETTLSSAKANLTDSKIADATNQERSKISQDQFNQSETIKQANSKMLNDMAVANMNADIQSTKEYIDSLLRAREFNANTLNEKWKLRAEAKTDAIMGIARTGAQTKTANAATWANAIHNSAGLWSNALNNVAKYNQDVKMTKFKLDGYALDKFNMSEGNRDDVQTSLDTYNARITELENKSTLTDAETQQLNDLKLRAASLSNWLKSRNTKKLGGRISLKRI